MPAATEPHVREDFLGYLRWQVEQQYHDHPTGCGGSFDELLCWELHHGGHTGSGLTFNWLAAKWGIPVAILGDLIADHCRRLAPGVCVDHDF